MKTSIVWLRRDLRLQDNTALHCALEREESVLPLFIFDRDIISELVTDDPRITFIHEQLQEIQNELRKYDSSLLCKWGSALEVWKDLIKEIDISAIYLNEDYEPSAILRDNRLVELATESAIPVHIFKDQVIYAKKEVVKSDDTPYTIFTPYKNKWKQRFQTENPRSLSNSNYQNFHKSAFILPQLGEMGFSQSTKIKVQPYSLDNLTNYPKTRDYPQMDGTSYLGPHLRFGTIGIRSIIDQLDDSHEIFLSELIWREFFMQILYNFPKVVSESFRAKYDRIQWRNNEEEFEQWCHGKTGYPMVDAGMRQLNETGYMHNRVRMVTASFLCKHLLIDWRWGEAYFAEKLLDYELSSNNGNWQWAAGTGCDAAPYFRVFNPSAQLQRFDQAQAYVRKWIPELGTDRYPSPIVDHKAARERAISTYKVGIS